MMFFDQLPLSMNALILASLVVCAGTSLQVATGVGLGLLAGPILLLNLASETAIFVAIILNLLVSVALLPQERGNIVGAPLRLLLVGTLVGIPVGWLFLNWIDVSLLKLFSGAVVLVASVQLLMLGRPVAASDGGAISPASTLAGGGLSGFMSGCLAIPGPIAMWTLLRHNLSASATRATLRAAYIFSYGTALIVHAGLGGIPTAGWRIVLILLPALIAGVGLGIVAKHRVGEVALHRALRFLLLAMGTSLLWKGILDVAT